MNESTKDLRISGLNPDDQNTTVNYAMSKLIEASIAQHAETGNSTIKTGPILALVKADIQALYDGYMKLANGNPESNAGKKAAKTKAILDEYAKFSRITADKMKFITGAKVTDEGVSNVSDEEIAEGDSAAGGLEKTTFNDDWTFTMDSKSTASANLKKFFSAIENRKDGLIKTTNIGLPEIIPFDIVYNTLHEILAGLPASYEKMEAKMEASTMNYTWLQSVIEKLDDAPQDIKNEFVSDMTKHAIKMRFVMWKKTENGYILTSQDANASSTEKRLRTQWELNMKDSNNNASVLTVNNNNDYVFDSVKVSKIVAQAKEWEIISKDFAREAELPPTEDLVRWLHSVGIKVDARTIDDLKRGKFKNKGSITYARLFSDSRGLIKVLSTTLSKLSDTKYDDSKLMNDTVVKSLAMMDSLYIDNVFSNSFSAGGKTLYTFTNNNYLVNRMRDLKDSDEEGKNALLEELKQIAFTKGSLWINDIENTPEFNDAFGIDYLSLEALKKEFTATKDGRKLNNLTEDEHEVVKMAMFFTNKGKVINKEERRRVSFFYPTVSDKSTMMVVNALSREIKLNENGDLSNANIDTLYEALVMPEISRMVSKHATNVKGYKPNAFYFVPSLNEKIVTLNGKESTVLNHVLESGGEITPELRLVITEELKTVMKELINEKIETWDRLGVGNDGSFINDVYLTSVAKGALKPKDGQIVGDKIKYSITDFVYNSLIANAELFKLTIGDPALYGKGNSKNIIENIETTYVNITKRLAGDLAPGRELADSDKNRYFQIFINDAKTRSKTYLNKIFDSLSEKNKALYTEVNGKGEGSIEGSDAQEYTTWKEHLYVLKQEGSLSTNQYNVISKKLRNSQRLDFDELGLVLQPMKPVYSGNIADVANNVDRRVYIKSSAFPLLPQLTAGLEIDMLRKKMEAFEENEAVDNLDGTKTTVRAAFNTAAKVGGVTNALDLYDENGNMLDFEIKKENVLLLPRKNFRIQQDIPYNHEKEAINIGVQNRKLLFSNILGTTGFKFNGNDTTGSELKAMYDNEYKELFLYKQKELAKELGLATDVNQIIDPQTLLNKLESNIFTSIETANESLKTAESDIDKAVINDELANNVGTKQLARAEYINNNFEAIVNAMGTEKGVEALGKRFESICK